MEKIDLISTLSKFTNPESFSVDLYFILKNGDSYTHYITNPSHMENELKIRLFIRESINSLLKNQIIQENKEPPSKSTDLEVEAITVLNDLNSSTKEVEKAQPDINIIPPSLNT